MYLLNCLCDLDTEMSGFKPWLYTLVVECVCPLSYIAGLVCILYGLLEGPGEVSILGKMEVSFTQSFFS